MSRQIDSFLEIFDSIEFNKIIDHPNILIAARFWEHERYCAAEIFYKFMRKIDDMIDDYKSSHKIIKEPEKKEFEAQINDWLKMITESEGCNPLQKELIHTFSKFRIPLWPLEAFARSMIYDIYNDGFPTIESFIEYSQGASVAPASIFVHLNGLTLENGVYREPVFDVKEAATPCALFSYLVHIIRDFQKDQLNNLNYFAEDLIKKHGLTRKDLSEIARGHPVNDGFRNLIKDYYLLAKRYLRETEEMIKKIGPLHEQRYLLSLQIIFNLYMMVFERIDVDSGTFTTKELNPTSEETRQRVYDTIMAYSEC
jgi:phytoene/squalene synthetase